MEYEKNIEEMYQEFLSYKFNTEIDKFSYKGMCENFYRKGYRKENDTVREIFEKIFEVLCCFTTQGKSENYNEGYIDCLAEVDKRLQNLAKEKYGVDLGE